MHECGGLAAIDEGNQRVSAKRTQNTCVTQHNHSHPTCWLNYCSMPFPLHNPDPAPAPPSSDTQQYTRPSIRTRRAFVGSAATYRNHPVIFRSMRCYDYLVCRDKGKPRRTTDGLLSADRSLQCLTREPHEFATAGRRVTNVSSQGLNKCVTWCPASVHQPCVVRCGRFHVFRTTDSTPAHRHSPTVGIIRSLLRNNV